MNATFVLVRSHSPIFFPVSFPPPPPNRSLLRVWPGVVAALRRGAQTRPLPLLSASSPASKRNVRRNDPSLNIARENSANPPEAANRKKKKRAEWVIRGTFAERREAALCGNRRRSSSSRRRPAPAPFPATSWRTSPLPQTTGVTTARTITTTAISPP